MSEEETENNIELMIDIETMGTKAGAPVITIGATLFDPFSCDSSTVLLERSLLIRVDISEALKYSTGVDGSTLRWWLEQEDAAIKELVGEGTVTMKEALQKLTRYCNERGKFVDNEFFPGLSDLPRACFFWAKDPDFDMRLLEYYYDHPDISGVQMPWKFFNNMSVRTAQRLAWPDGDRPEFDVSGGVAHDARWDAVVQALSIQAAMKKLNLSKDHDVEYTRFVT